MMDTKVKTTVYPDEAWLFGVPEDFGLDSTLVRAAVADIFTIEKRYGVLIVKDGVIMHENIGGMPLQRTRFSLLTKALARP